MVDKGSVVIVKKFIDLGEKPVQMTEMSEFWKSCTEEEKIRFTNEAITIAPQLGAPRA